MDKFLLASIFCHLGYKILYSTPIFSYLNGKRTGGTKRCVINKLDGEEMITCTQKLCRKTGYTKTSLRYTPGEILQKSAIKNKYVCI